MGCQIDEQIVHDGLHAGKIKWIRLEDKSNPEYPIDYSIAVLDSRPDEGEIDVLMKWEPNCFCHFHKHIATTTTLVISGEHHVIEEMEGTVKRTVRGPGSFARKAPGDVHKEHAGASGSLVFFSMKSPDGKLFEVLDEQENFLRTSTIEEFITAMLDAKP